MLDQLVQLRDSSAQAKFVSNEQLARWLKACQSKSFSNDDILFMATRNFGGVGGSEAGSILSGFMGYHISSSDLNDGFKTADSILLEKLFISIPFKTPYADRGNKIEGMILDLTSKRLNIHEVDKEAEESARSHKTATSTKGNVDRIYRLPNGQRLLIDAKSSSADTGIKFSHIAQVNQYAEICRSNGVTIDAAATSNLVCDESVFKFLVSLYENKDKSEDQRRDYDKWCDDIIAGRFPFINFSINKIDLSPELGARIVASNERFINDYVAKGLKSIRPIQKTPLIQSELEQLNEYSKLAYQYSVMANAAKTNMAAVELKVSEVLNKVDGDPLLPEGIVRFSRKSVFNSDLAIEALKIAGFDLTNIEKQSNQIDVDQLLGDFISLGGEVSDRHYAKTYDSDDLKKALETMGISKENFLSNPSYSMGLSSKSAFKDKITSDQIELQSSLAALANNYISIDESNSEPESKRIATQYLTHF